MATLWRVQVKWGGDQIGQGFSNFYFTSGIGTQQQAADAVKALFVGVYGTAAVDLPTGITLTFPTTVDNIIDSTGTLTVSDPVTTTGPLSGSSSSNYSAPSGLVINWLTGAIIAGRHVRGKTFFVPLGGGQYNNDGTPSAAVISAANAAAATLISAAPELVVWHRPTSAAAADGASFPVVAPRINARAAMLTSRR